MAGIKRAQQHANRVAELRTDRLLGGTGVVAPERAAERRQLSESTFVSLLGESAFAWLSAVYRSIVDTSPDAITLTSTEGKVVFCNQQAAALYGFQRTEDLVGRDGWDFVAPEELQRASEDNSREQRLLLRAGEIGVERGGQIAA